MMPTPKLYSLVMQQQKENRANAFDKALLKAGVGNVNLTLHILPPVQSLWRN